MKQTLPERFWSKVAVGEADECWEWQAYRDHYGYGRIQSGPKRGPVLLAHRAVLHLEGVEIPEGMTVDHTCANRGCVNPAHLEVVPRHENIRRGGNNKPRQGPVSIGKCGHPITPQFYYFSPKGRMGYCKVCRTEKRQWRSGKRKER